MNTQVIPPLCIGHKSIFSFQVLTNPVLTTPSLPRLSFLNSPTAQKMRWRTWYLSSSTISSFHLSDFYVALYLLFASQLARASSLIQKLWSVPRVCALSSYRRSSEDNWQKGVKALKATDKRYGKREASMMLRHLNMDLAYPLVWILSCKCVFKY